METGNKVPKKDLRVQKTQNALFSVLFTLLGNRSFNEITVNDLCSQASVSRATFYTHFNDKYDLLKFFMSEIWDGMYKVVSGYDELERSINSFIDGNKRMIANIVRDANSETMMHIHGFVATIVEHMIKRSEGENESPEHVILLNFITGGIVNMLFWQVLNNFPAEISMMNTYLYKMLKTMTYWDEEHRENALGK